MAFTIPPQVLESYKTAHSLANGTPTAAATPQLVSQWAVQQQMISPAQASEYMASQGGAPATAASGQPALTVNGVQPGTLNLNSLVNPVGAGTTPITVNPGPTTAASGGGIPATNVGGTGVTLPVVQNPAGPGPGGGLGMATVNAAPGGGAAPGGTTGKNYDKAIALFQQSHPGVNLASPEGQQAFNQWSGTTFGAGGYENAPDSAFGNAGSPANNTSLKLFGDLPSQVGEAKAVLDGAGGDANSSQVQGSNQVGAFQTGGSTNTSGTQTQVGSNKTTGTTDQNTVNKTTGTQTTGTIGTTGQDTTGTTTQTGTNTIKPVDTLGFGDLLKGQQGAAVTDANTTRGFLTDLVQNGPKQQQALTGAAVRNAMTGPQMTGAGDNAHARAAGYAGELVERNSMAQQLEAARQLAGGTAVTSLATAANPFIGSENKITGTTGTTGHTTGTNTANTTNTTDMTNTGTVHGSSDTLNLSDLVNNSTAKTDETQSGVSSAGSVQAGIGKQPIQQTSGGGCYVCTAYVEKGWLYRHTVDRAARWKLSQPRYYQSLCGYSLYGPWLARLVLRSPLFARLFFPVVVAILRQELRLSGIDMVDRRWDRFCHGVFDHGSRWLAILTRQKRVKQCDPIVAQLLKQHNLLYPCLLG